MLVTKNGDRITIFMNRDDARRVLDDFSAMEESRSDDCPEPSRVTDEMLNRIDHILRHWDEDT